MATRENYNSRANDGEIRRTRRTDHWDRSANDVRMNPASPEAISNILDSFSAISMSSGDTATLRPGKSFPITPTKSLHSNTSRRRAKESTPSTRDSSFNFTEYNHPDIQPQDLPPEEDAAEPPVVRTARPPSGMSRISSTQPSSTRMTSSRSPSVPSTPVRLDTPQAERQDRLSPLRGNSIKRGYKTTSGRSSTESIRSVRNLDSFTAPVGSTKGKERAQWSPTRTPSADGPTTYEISGPTTPERASSLRLAATRLDYGGSDAADGSGPSGLVRRKSPRPQSRTDRKYITDDQERDEGSVPNGESSSLIGGPSLKSFQNPMFQNTSAIPPRSSSRPQSRDATSGQQEDLTMPSPTIKRHGKNSVEIEDRNAALASDEETDVMRRIRELKAAKEERRKSLASESRIKPTTNAPVSMSPSTIPMSPSHELPPETSSASKQLMEAANVNERKVVSSYANGIDSPRLGSGAVTPTVQKISAARSPSVAGSTKSIKSTRSWKDRVFFSSRSNQKDKASLEQSIQNTPTVSRPGSRSRRYSGTNLASPRKSDVSRAHTGLSNRHTSIDENRVSTDSIPQSVTEFLQAPRLSQKVMAGGEDRIISFSEVGDPDGYPVFCCIGMGLTRYVMAFYDELAISLKLRLITPERPGIGDSAPRVDGSRIPLTWPDDVQTICNKLRIREFALLAHSAGAIYALATALRMPQHIRCKIHLLAPWIPPSQLSSVGLPQSAPQPTGSVPKTQRFLRVLPTPFLKLSNSRSFGLSSLSRKESSLGNGKNTDDGRNAIVNSTSPRSGQSQGLQTPRMGSVAAQDNNNMTDAVSLAAPRTPKMVSKSNSLTGATKAPSFPGNASIVPPPSPSERVLTEEERQERQRRFDAALTPKIWEYARYNANPAVDLIVCLERNHPIGFRYVDIHRAVVIHHGSKDTRVPVDNAKWLGKTMRRTEVRVLDGEGHSLMASAGVMGNILTELSKEWDEGPEAVDSSSTSRGSRFR